MNTLRKRHFNLTTFVQWEDYEYTEKTRTRIMLQGMTDKEPGQLVPLAKSWLQAPEMKINSDAFSGGEYDPSERAYIIEKTDPGHLAPCTLVFDASEESPLLNPAIIIKNWGNQQATLSIDGKKWEQREDFRQGILKKPYGEDLIMWIRLESQKPVEIIVE